MKGMFPGMLKYVVTLRSATRTAFVIELAGSVSSTGCAALVAMTEGLFTFRCLMTEGFSVILQLSKSVVTSLVSRKLSRS